MSTFLITGGAGFIGSNFVNFLLSKSPLEVTSVIVLDNLTYSGVLTNIHRFKEDARFRFVRGNILDGSLVTELMSEVEYVVNFAAESHVDRSIHDPLLFIDTNIRGLAVLMNSYISSRAAVFLQVSTDEVYGSIESGSADENYPLLPNSPYAASKASGDLLVRSYIKTFGKDIRITRCGNNFGPFQHPEKLIPKLIINILEGRNLPLYGNGSNIREWVSVYDHCKGIYSALISKTQYGIFNIGSDNYFSNIEIAELLLTFKKDNSSKIEYVPDRLGHDFRYSLDYSYATECLDYLPSSDFLGDLERTFFWYSQNRNWWEILLD